MRPPLPVVGATPGVAGGSRLLGGGSAGSSPVAGLGLGGPVLGHLVATGGGADGGSSSRGRGGSLAVSRPVLDTVLTTPVLLGGSSIEVPGLHHLSLGSLSPFLLLLLGLLGVAVEEQVGHNLPRRATADGSSQSENLTGQHPPHQTDAVGG